MDLGLNMDGFREGLMEWNMGFIVVEKRDWCEEGIMQKKVCAVNRVE